MKVEEAASVFFFLDENKCKKGTKLGQEKKNLERFRRRKSIQAKEIERGCDTN